MSIVRREENVPRETDAPASHEPTHLSHTHTESAEAQVGRYPPVNISATEKSLVVRAELCLKDISNLDLAIAGTSLILQGYRDTDPDLEGVVYHRRERGYGSFHRAIALPIKVEEKDIDATYQDGVLTVILPRTEVERPRQISVKATEK